MIPIGGVTGTGTGWPEGINLKPERLRDILRRLVPFRIRGEGSKRDTRSCKVCKIVECLLPERTFLFYRTMAVDTAGIGHGFEEATLPEIPTGEAGT